MEIQQLRQWNSSAFQWWNWDLRLRIKATLSFKLKYRIFIEQGALSLGFCIIHLLKHYTISCRCWKDNIHACWTLMLQTNTLYNRKVIQEVFRSFQLLGWLHAFWHYSWTIQSFWRQHLTLPWLKQFGVWFGGLCFD